MIYRCFIFIFLIGSKFLTVPVGASQENLDYMARFLQLSYSVIDNFSLVHFRGKIVLKNTGDSTIEKSGWRIHFCHITPFSPPDSSSKYNPSKYGVSITAINGCMHKLEPLKSFKPIAPGESRTIYFRASYNYISKSSIMPNWYVTYENFEPRIILSTAGESLSFVGPFDTAAKWRRSKDDAIEPYTAEVRYAKNSQMYDIPKGYDVRNKVIPTVVQMNLVKGGERISIQSADWVIIASSFPMAANDLSCKMPYQAPVLTKNSSRETRSIRFVSGNPISDSRLKKSLILSESYKIQIDSQSESIKITASTEQGAFYAVQTLESLFSIDWTLPAGEIVDGPRFQYRGLELDVARNFVPKKDIIKLLDVMASYKLNRLHFHLTDDEGWRLYIPGMEELTKIGSKRCHDMEEKRCLLPQLGSGPTTQTSGSGYYTDEDYKNILDYAAKLHIEVLPEFDMPGHIRAAIKALETRKDGKYRISEENDPSKYRSVQYFTDNALNPCLDSTYEFVEKLIDTVQDMHKGRNVLKTFVFGGDEVAKGAWVNSTACANLIKNSKTISSVGDLKEYFFRRVLELTLNKNVNLAGWEDGLYFKKKPYKLEYMNKDVLAFPWNNVWEWGAAGRAYELANNGYKVVMSQATHLYLDHPQEPDPEERGYHWATRFTDAKTTFSFNPFNLYSLIKFSRFGKPLNADNVCGPRNQFCPKLEKPENIIGMQGLLWSETVRTPEQLYSQIFPRLIAIANRAWHKAMWEDEKNKERHEMMLKKDWAYFSRNLGLKEFLRLDKAGIDYHVAVPGARVNKYNVLEANTGFPGLKVEYSVDGGMSYTDYMKPVKVRSKVTLRSRSADGRRVSRSTNVKLNNSDC